MKKERMKGQIPKGARRLTGPHRIRAGFDRIAEHVDRGVELLADCGSPEVDHKAGALYSLAFGANE